jgi:peptide-methionine (S)-S-oxide reductase
MRLMCKPWRFIAAFVTGLSLQAVAATAPAPPAYETAIFAGGCFWCMEAPFDRLEGVISTTPGYTGGHTKNPTYKDVSNGGTGHAEAVQIIYDPEKLSYTKLLDVFWHNVDPTNAHGQFCDNGDQYRSEIFYQNEDQRRKAIASEQDIEKHKPFAAPIVTKITPAATFYPAEEYHHDYYQKNPIRYKYYRYRCGRDQRLEELWNVSAH